DHVEKDEFVFGIGARLLRHVGVLSEKKRQRLSRWRRLTNEELDRLQVFGCGLTAAPIGLHVEREFLALVELAHARTLDRRDVNEHIGAAVVLNDKAVTLLGVEEFNGTCGHQWPPYKNAQRRRCPYKPFRMGRISGFCVFLARAVMAETTR